jgi:hypothetical protein
VWLSSLTAKQREALLGLAHNIAVSDGLLDPNEEMMLNDFKREMELNPATESQYLELGGVDEVFNLLRLSYVDGAFEIEEECLLKEVSRAFGVADSEFRLMDNWVRRLVALEEEARAFM